MPVLSNLFASRRRIALLLNLDERDLVEGWIRLSQRRVPPVPSREAPVQEQIFTGDQIDLGRYPIPIHFEVDAGQYITGGVVLSRDPDTGVGNLSYAACSSSDLRLRRQPPPVATCGTVIAAPPTGDPSSRRAHWPHPAIALAADRIPPDDDGWPAGGLMGTPVPVVPACRRPARTGLHPDGHRRRHRNAANVDEGPLANTGSPPTFHAQRAARCGRDTAGTPSFRACRRLNRHPTLSESARRASHQLKQAILKWSPSTIPCRVPISIVTSP